MVYDKGCCFKSRYNQGFSDYCTTQSVILFQSEFRMVKKLNPFMTEGVII